MALPAETTHQFEGKNHADLYLEGRPEWPQEIIQRVMQYLLLKKLPPQTLALDVGCGSGQNTIPLAPHFERVVGVDVSKAQTEAGRRRTDKPTNVEFQVGSAEDLLFADDNSVDLVTCATSFHWFDKEAFFKQADRVLKPSGCIAIYWYNKIHPCVEGDVGKNEKIRQTVIEMDSVTLRPYTTDCVKSLEGKTDETRIPYEDNIRDDTIELLVDSTMALYVKYVRSWSEYQHYTRQIPGGQDLAKDLQDKLMDIMGLDGSPEGANIKLKLPVTLLLGRKPNP
ncbi:putative methyltransferase DDB_G0268948 isoform X1 [Asterias rubens]|uniref:putative methyltransferase DDB_G0268948 isoform X1 n=1 Tax=Asterias rubens TaxID=7604 RepID=UPI0014558A89|nr:putative methyltransferase DDB_G0268948 isoform X1 [Asterias rubens]XP_033629925.1 putative methyltransferase DDB_G0268948 isoform X1 [Asterias rubens]